MLSLLSSFKACLKVAYVSRMSLVHSKHLILLTPMMLIKLAKIGVLSVEQMQEVRSLQQKPLLIMLQTHENKPPKSEYLIYAILSPILPYL